MNLSKPQKYMFLQAALAALAILLILVYILTELWWPQPLALLLIGVSLGLEMAPKLLKEALR